MATLQAQTFDGLPGGMNLAVPAHEIEDNEARYIQDALLDYPGLLRRRGPVRAASGFVTLTKKASGIIGTINPAGSYRVGVFDGDGSTGRFQMLSSDYASATAFTWNGFLPQSPYYIVDTKPTLLGGATLGTSSQYNSASPTQSLGFWRGANVATYSTGTLTLTRGSSVVTGSGTTWSTNVAPGSWLYATISDITNLGKFTLTYVGIVKSVDSNTQLTLLDASPYTTSGSAYETRSVRGLQFKVMKGRITTSTSNTTVTGANTKFLSQYMDETVYSATGTTSGSSAVVTAIPSTTTLKVGMRVTGTNIAAGSFISTIDSGTQITMNQNASGAGTQTLTYKHGWNLYRASDMTWIGRVTLVNNELSITLAANSTVALNNEKFVALCGTGDWSLSTMADIHKVGFLNAFYAGRQWYANNGQKLLTTSRVWFSEVGDPEGLDLSAFDGDFFDVSSSVGTDTPIKALIPAYNGLVVIKENETYAITGSTPTTFSLKKIQDDGTLCGMSAQPYGGGVVWAGLDGIYFYDGITVNNLTSSKLGDYYKNAVRNMNPNTYRMWGMIVRNHYMLFIENLAPSVAVLKGTLSSTPTALTIVINMETQGITMFTNVAIRGYTETPADTGKQNLYIVNDSTKGNICQGFDLFDVEANDTILCDLGTAAGVYRYGQTTLGSATAFNAVADTKYFSKITVSAKCAVSMIRAYSIGQGGGSANCNVRAGIYSDVAGVPTTLLGSSGVTVLKQDDGPAFRDYTFSTPVELAAGNYWIGVQVETSGRVKFYQGATAAANAEAADAYSDALEDPFGSYSTNIGPLVAFAQVYTVGPDFYLESKKYTEGDSMHKKLFKQLALNYIVQGDSIRLDTVPGLQTIGKTSTSAYPNTVYTWDQLVALVGTWDALSALFPTWDALTQANFRPKRVKFLKRTQMLSFRLWQNSPAVSRLQLGPFQLAFKWQRLGRI